MCGVDCSCFHAFQVLLTHGMTEIEPGKSRLACQSESAKSVWNEKWMYHSVVT